MDALYYQMDLLKTLNEKLIGSDRINKEFLDLSGNAYFYYNCADEYFEATGDWKGLTGMGIQKLTDTELLYDCVQKEDEEALREILLADETGMREMVREICLKDGKTWIEASAFVKYSENHENHEKFVCIKDITKFKAQNDELTYMAYYDSLTGLYNRNYFVQQLRKMIEKAEKNHTSVSVIMLDIDEFKKVNDSIGLILGDELIQDFGQFLSDFKNDHTIIGRFGADVFILGIYDPCGRSTVENIHHEIKMRLKRPFTLSSRDEIYINISTGVAEYPDAGDSAFVIIKNAEVCMFHTKEENRGGIRYFDESVLNRFLKTVSMEQRLRDAIDSEGFILYFQPQYDCRNGKLRGCEALIRWQDENGDFISPTEFIPLAEKSGGIVPIGNWVLKEALMIYSAWKRQFQFDGIISINISAVQIHKDNFATNIIRLLEQFDVSPKDVELEITESVFINNFDEVISKMTLLRDHGVKVSLDDFGTGFSSLSYLKDLPIDTLKIDKTFIDTVLSDTSTGIITESVVSMVKKLGFETVAEGVETEAQYQYLKSIECDNIQGFYLGRPMAREEFEILLMRSAGTRQKG
ncbi:bifunctional diguanylate cyclase/phosphodiesterase [bacterium C-53]|nr:bifunctional diguanylate cyclase/phosphodiesterase [Lachnospiraceae bacterium]NBI01939.1 bifunctional diguanylate cyclase/phosphodiesterase [Lachnospiraceae bacterium]RKJ12339.1 bifunctional diguanylate cyclase/phosphodiesterase [bacterium C-53]